MLEQEELQVTVDRMQQMEQYFDEVKNALVTRTKRIHEDATIQKMIQALTEYMDGGQWLQN